MNVILLKDVDNLGEEGDIVSVKNGYGRNYLIPQGFALLATDGIVRARQEERRQAARKMAKAQEDAEAQAKELANMEVSVYARVGEENRIFGTITPTQVADQLNQKGFEVDRRNVSLDEEIKMIGVFTATVKLHPKVSGQVKVRVLPEL